ncbi:glycosyltransferase family 2 protein [Niabella aurantiaca]|uniref:glycosyltransferase family 2 protein n=1 Tax=Niabella aurantiaca TaxID=379900 RepID=UPI00037881A8|nr:glycosyltransferase family 2 protein [Niabella aurantiaca]
MSFSNSICVVIPTYNEAGVIKETLNDLLTYGYTIVLVDDGSSDNTKEMIIGLPVYYLRHAVNLGQGAAIQTGLNFARGLPGCDYFVTFDADGQHPAEKIRPMTEFLISKNLDIVLGSRFQGTKALNMSRTRTMLLKMARIVNYFFSGLFLTDAHNGFRVMNRKAIEAIHLNENGMAHATEILMQIRDKKLTYDEFPVVITYTNYSLQKGQQNLDSIKILRQILINKLFK